MNNEKENQEDVEDISEENNLKTNNSAGEFDVVEEARDAESRKRKIVFGAIAGIIFLSIVGFSVWYYLLKSDEGKPVPAPRNTSLGGSDSGEKLPAGEQKITLTDAQLAAADLKIVTVGETLDAASITETTTGIVRANDYAQTPVISQLSGVIKTINANLGQTVRRGQTIAIVASQELADTQAKFLSMKAELDEAEKRYKRALSLSEISEESRNELDKTNADLKSAEAKFSEAKINYERSKKLVEIGAISRRQLEIVTTELKVSEANVREAKNRFERANKLLKIDPIRKNEIDQFLTKLRNQRAEIASVREKLFVFGLSKQRVDGLRSPGQISSELPIPSPISGTVTERIANQGEVVSMNAKLAQITDLSTIWVIGQVYEKDLGRLRIGSGASITSDAFPGELFRGQIAYVDPTLDEKTRTAQVRIEIPNPNQKLKIGQYVTVAYASLGGSEKTAPLVPKDAVQSMGDRKVVFEATDDPKTFIIRTLRLGQEKENAYPVAEGIFVGDKIVSEGSFLLRAEYLKTNSAGN